MNKRQLAEKIVIALVGEPLANNWWHGYNLAFEQTPDEQWQQDPDSVLQYLNRFSQGEW
jgi:hypothetical protein